MQANSTSSKWALRKGKPIGPWLLPYFHFGTQEKNCSEGVKKVNARPTELWDRGTDCGNVTGCGGQGGGREAGESRRRQAERLGPAATGRMLPQPGEAERVRQPGDADRAEAGLGHRDAAGDTAAARLGAAAAGGGGTLPSQHRAHSGALVGAGGRPVGPGRAGFGGAAERVGPSGGGVGAVRPPARPPLR